MQKANNLKISTDTPVKCPNCGGIYFLNIFSFYKQPIIALSPEIPPGAIIAVPEYSCAACATTVDPMQPTVEKQIDEEVVQPIVDTTEEEVKNEN